MAMILIAGRDRREVNGLAKAVGIMGHRADMAFDMERVKDRAASRQPDLVLFIGGDRQAETFTWLQKMRALPDLRKVVVICFMENDQGFPQSGPFAGSGIVYLSKPIEFDKLEKAIQVQLGYVGK